MIRLILFTGALVLLAGAARAESGKWVADGKFGQINVACAQSWICQPSQTIMYGDDKRLMTTPPESTRGMCMAGDGPVDSCNLCSAPPPQKQCEWRLEKR
jgi:hypothetical protein